MNANELRLGNWVNADDSEIWIDKAKNKPIQITIDDFGDIEHVNPIPITSQILDKAGFEPISNTDIYRKYLTTDEILWKGNEVIIRNREQRFELNVKCLYVHQLQNIVFALTGEELNIQL